jgi:bacillithiol system protein YtxJ
MPTAGECLSILQRLRGAAKMGSASLEGRKMGNNLKELTSVEELKQVITESNDKPVLLFKHSLTCPISARAFRELQTFLDGADAQLGYTLITVQKARPVSNEAASTLGVKHETPQAILIRNGREVWNASHFDITADSLRRAIRNHSD